MSIQSLTGRPEVAALAVNGGDPVNPGDPVQLISVQLSDDDVAAAVAVLRSGMLVQGKKVAELEERFAGLSEARFAVACANGTCALQLAYGPLIGPGDEVLVPAWSYIATVSMVVAAGARPVWVDADPETYSMDVGDAAAKVTPRTRAIACTHLYGNPVDVDAVERLAAEHGLKVVYDAAQAHHARYQGRGLGAFGDAVTYSFYPTKNMTTCEGGMVTTNDENLASTLRALRSHGETEKYLHHTIGFNYRMSDCEAAIGVSQLARLPERTERRRANAARLTAAIAAIPGLHAPVPTAGAEPAYHLYAVRVDPEAFVDPGEGRLIRDVLCAALAAEGVSSAVHYPRSLTRQPVFDQPGVEHPPVADRLAKTLFCVPVHHGLTEREVDLVGEALWKVAAAYRV
jgi:perosamine synthetase